MKKLLSLLLFIIPFSVFCQFGDYIITSETRGNSDSFQIITTYVKKKVIPPPVDTIINNNSVYYISNTGIDNVSRTGKKGQEWRSLAFAITRVKPGSIIHLNAGTYNINSQISVPEGISIEGEGTDKTILTSSIATANTPVLRYISSAEGTNGNQSISNLTLDGLNTSLIPLWIWGRSNVEVHHCRFKDFLQRGIAFSGKLNFGDGAPTTYATGNSIHDCTIDNCAEYINGSAQGNLNISGQEGMLIYNNIITATSRPTYKNGVCIKMTNNRGYNKGCKIYNNTLTCALTSTSVSYHSNFSLEIWNNQGLEIYGNNLYGTVDIGGDFETKGVYDYSVSLHHNFIGHTNVLEGIKRQGIILEANTELSDVYIYKNTIKNIVNGIDLSTSKNAIYRNIFIHYNTIEIAYIYSGYPAAYGIRMNYGTNAGYKISDWYIRNNTIIGKTIGNFKISGALRITTPQSGAIERIYFENNIVQGIDYALYQLDGTMQIGSFYSRNNIYYDTGEPVVSVPVTLYVNKNNSTENPLFISSTDYHLQSSSPAINAGIDGENIGAF